MAKLIPGPRGKNKLSYRGYVYNLDKDNDLVSYWYCEHKSKYDCKGRAISKSGKENEIDVKEKNDHSHPPDATRQSVLSVVNSVKERAKLTNEKPANIIRGVKRSLEEVVVNDLPNDSALKQAAKRQRIKSTGAENLKGLNFVIPDILNQFEDGRLFTIADYCHEDNRIIVFSTDTLLSMLCDSEMILMDGTFKICPTQFSQLYTIHCLVKVEGNKK